MKIDGYSDNREAHVHERPDSWHIYPDEFAVFVQGFEFPEEIPMAVPSFVAPDIASDDPSVVVATWMFVMRAYLSMDAPPYEFEVRGYEEPETDDPGDLVY
jgi:hypothetical protein